MTQNQKNDGGGKPVGSEKADAIEGNTPERTSEFVDAEFNSLKSELQKSFAAPEADYTSIDAATVVARNKAR
jgi:hypothetical protein